MSTRDETLRLINQLNGIESRSTRIAKIAAEVGRSDIAHYFRGVRRYSEEQSKVLSSVLATPQERETP